MTIKFRGTREEIQKVMKRMKVRVKIIIKMMDIEAKILVLVFLHLKIKENSKIKN